MSAPGDEQVDGHGNGHVDGHGSGHVDGHGNGQPAPRKRRFWRRHSDMPVVELQRVNPVRYGVIMLVVLAVVGYLGFTKHVPFKHGFTLKAEFASAQNLLKKSPVRIAGVNVGVVTGIQRDGKTGLVTMEIEKKGLPIHEDTELKIRPRIFLEGNWFIELQPGTPASPDLSSGATVPVAQTADPVQLDQVLDALNTDTRANLQKFLIYYGEGLTLEPNEAENAEQEPIVRGLTGAQAINRTYHAAPESLRGTAIANQALAGSGQEDLSKLVASIGKVTSALNVHEQQLGELIGNFNTFFAAFASKSSSVRALVATLPSSLRKLDEGLAGLDSSFGPTKQFAHDIEPGVKLTPSTVNAAVPWIEQVDASLSPSELGGVAKGLDEATPSLATLEGEQVPLYKQTDLFNKCLTSIIYPAGNTKLQDSSATSGVEDYKEFWYSLVGLNGIGQNFNGNGTYGRFLVGNSGQTLRTQETKLLDHNFAPEKTLRLLGRSPLPPLGTRPAYPAEEPPYEPLVPCYTQTLPNFNGPLSQGPADGSE